MHDPTLSDDGAVNPLRSAARPRVGAAVHARWRGGLTGMVACAGALALSPDVAAQQCLPECRSGFVCISGQCVSACNPPCPLDQVCTAAAACVPATARGAAGDSALSPPVSPVYPPGGYPGVSYPGPSLYSYPAVVPVPGAHLHDGFYLHLALGGGGIAIEPGPGSVLGGGGMGFDLFLGGALTPHLILVGAVSESISSVPVAKASALVASVGPGLIYYTADNLFAGGSIGLGFVQLGRNQDANQYWETGAGLALMGEAGKEWWISPNWGLGVGLRVQYVRSKEDQAGPFPPVWTATDFDLLVSATYN